MDIRRYFTSSQSKAATATNEKKKPEISIVATKKISKGKVTKRPSLTIDSDSDEDVIPAKRSRSSKTDAREDPLPSSKKSKKVKVSKELSKKLTIDEDPLPPKPSKNNNQDDFEILDDEDPLPPIKKRTSNRKCLQIIDDSDDDGDFVKKTSENKPSALKEKPSRREASRGDKTITKDKKTVLSVSDYFGTEHVHRITKKDDDKNKSSRSLEKRDFFNNDNNNVAKQDTSVVDKASSTKTQEIKVEAMETSPVQKEKMKSQSVTPSSNKKDKSKTETTPNSERKFNAAAYQSYLNRAGPSAPGSKVIPEGASNCLAKSTFVITGVLESLERDEIGDIIKKYGGKVTQSLSKNTSYIIVGIEAGPAKLEKAVKLGTKQLTEDSFLDLIRMSSAKTKNTEQTATSSKKSLFNDKDNSNTKEIPKKLPVESKMEVAHCDDTKVEKKKEDTASKSKVEVKNESSIKIEPKKLNRNDGPTNYSGDHLMWVDKYKPTSTQQVIGQQGPRSNVQKLKQWLSNWHKNNLGSNKSQKKNFGKWGSDDGSNFKAVLLSGSPGIGKTTTAQLACKETDFKFIELNASDTRSKKSLETIVAEMVHNKSLSNLMEGNTKNAHKHCLLMDEVDGMAGNQDRGGVQQLIQLIKTSQIPIICMCNDRQHMKIRSLANYCFDLRFQKPSVPALKTAMMNICAKEKLNISPGSLEDIIVGANQDVRQILHNLSMWTVADKTLTENDAAREAKKAKKDTKLSPFDALRLVFSADAHKSMSIHDKSDLFFYDYSMAGLFVQENYLSIRPDNVSKSNHIDLVSKAADSICDGDIVDKQIRSQSHWNLLPVEAMYASVIPGHILEGHLTQMVNFPSWLGRNSTRGKNDRLLQELHLHTRLRMSGSKVDLNCDYLPFLRNAIISPIVTRLQEGISDSIAVMNEYSLRREDLDSIIEVCGWPKQENPLKNLTPQIKAAFTRAYNKESPCSPYSVVSVAKKRVKAANMDDDVENLSSGDDEEPEDEDISKDSMVKVKAVAKRKSDKKADASTSSVRGGKGTKKRK